MAIMLAMWTSLVFGATPAGIVQGLQMPAWVEREGVKTPVKLGMVLQAGDRLVTGDSARLQLQLYEGSYIKLGENAQFEVAAFSSPKEAGGIFRGFLKVLKGAFRFTTTLLSKRHRREIDVRIITVTAGIRGTDLWGKAAPDKDIVCLIEGRITIQRKDGEPLTMSDPLTFYIAPKDAPPLPVQAVDLEQLKLWAAQTDLTEGQGVRRTDGRWVLSPHSFRKRTQAMRALQKLHRAGYSADIIEVTVNGQNWHRLIIDGFVSHREAMAFAHQIKDRLGVRGAWAYRD